MGTESQFAAPVQKKSLIESQGPSQSPPAFGLTAAPVQRVGDGSDHEPGMPTDDSYTYGEVENGVLFNQGAGDSDEIALNDVDQGGLADCYFLAALGAIAHSNPDHIRNMISDNGDGSYNVTLFGDENFWGDRSPEVHTVRPNIPLREDGTPAYAGLGDGPELWVAIVEKAFAQREGGYDEIEWGNAGNAMEILTGNDSTTVNIGGLSGEAILTGIQAKLDAGKPVTASSKDFGDSEKKTEAADNAGIVGKHVYVVEAVDVEAGTIDLFNPWGSGHQRGLSVDDFKTFFRRYQSTE